MARRMTSTASALRSGLTLSEHRALLVLGDALAVLAAMAMALTIWIWTDNAWASPVATLMQKGAPRLLWLIPLWFFLVANLYDPHVASSRGRTMYGLLLAAGISLVLYLALYFYAPRGALPRLVVLVFLVGVVVIELLWRLAYIRLLSLPALQQPALVVGAGRAGSAILRVLVREVPGHFRILGIVDDDPGKHGQAIEGVVVRGGTEQLRALVAEEGVTALILAITGDLQSDLFEALLECQERGVEVIRMPTLYEELLGRVPIAYLNSEWILTSFVDSARVHDLYSRAKRLFDILGALAGLLVVAVLFPLLALLVCLDSRGPVLYGQERSGRGGKPFRMVKFRTMVADAEPDGEARWAEPGDPRVTRIGRILRRTRLDEIPQFWNILRGEMSLVGPRAERPALVTRLESEVPFYRARMLARPGATGWAQVNYRYGWSVEDAATKLEYDLYYIRHRSLWLDLRIVLRTLGTVVRFQGT
jgi:exopolysaccharide biosynthesis polyprenyl glycosylphosphotransferase